MVLRWTRLRRLYAHRLGPGELPAAESFRDTARRPLEGTDAAVDGWMSLSRQLGGLKPHTDTWPQLDEEARITGGGRVWYLNDENKQTCWLTRAGTGHTRQAGR